MKVPYIQSPARNACALACHVMVAQAFFPEITMDQLKSILRWVDGKALWAFPFWKYLTERDIQVTDYDSIPYDVWAYEGFAGLGREMSPSVFSYFKENTHDPDSYQSDLKKLFNCCNGFTYIQRPSTIDDMRKALSEGAVCEAVVDSRALNHEDGFSLHRVVVLGMDDEMITFHDPVWPGARPRPNRKEKIDHFLKAWPSEAGGQDSAELCIYKKAD